MSAINGQPNIDPLPIPPESQTAPVDPARQKDKTSGPAQIPVGLLFAYAAQVLISTTTVLQNSVLSQARLMQDNADQQSGLNNKLKNPSYQFLPISSKWTNQAKIDSVQEHNNSINAKREMVSNQLISLRTQSNLLMNNFSSINSSIQSIVSMLGSFTQGSMQAINAIFSR